MATIRDIRKARLTEILAQLSISDVARKLNVERAYVSALKTGARNIGNKTARKIEAAFELPEGWMDIAGEHQPFGRAAGELQQLAGDASSSPEKDNMATSSTPQSRQALVLDLFSQLPHDLQLDAINLLQQSVDDLRSARARLKGIQTSDEPTVHLTLSGTTKNMKRGGTH